MILKFNAVLPCSIKEIEDRVKNQFGLKRAKYLLNTPPDSQGEKQLKVVGNPEPTGDKEREAWGKEILTFIGSDPVLNAKKDVGAKAVESPVVSKNILADIMGQIENFFGHTPGLVSIISGILEFIKHVGDGAEAAAMESKQIVQSELIKLVADSETDRNENNIEIGKLRSALTDANSLVGELRAQRLQDQKKIADLEAAFNDLKSSLGMFQKFHEGFRDFAKKV